jgi:hypothetical protein
MKNRHVNTIILGCGLIFALTTCVFADDAGTSHAVDSVQVQAIQQQMLNNPEIMTIILSLQNDPDMQALLNDPTLMAEIQAGKLNTFVHDPRLLRLLGKPQIKDVEQRLR